MKRKTYSIKKILVITLLTISIYSLVNNKANFSYGTEPSFSSLKLKVKHFLPPVYPPALKDSYAYFFPIDLINNDKFLFYYSKLNTLNLNSGEVTPLIIDSSVLAPWSLLGHSFENPEPGNFVILSENRIILPEIKDNSNKDNSSIRKNVSISAYDYNTGKLIWRTPLEALNLVELEHRYKLNLTEQGILYSSIDPFLLYCLDVNSGKIKWIYDAEKDFGNLSALYNIPASMAYWRSFQFFVEYFYSDGIVTYLSYSSKGKTPEEFKSIKKHLLISWDGRLISELKYEPIGFIEDKYIFYREDKNSSKYYIGSARLIDSSVIWQREIPLKLTTLYPKENTYFLFNEREISIPEIPCEILTDYYFLLGGRNDKEDFVNCFSIKTGQNLWTYSLPKGSLSNMYPFEDKVFIHKNLEGEEQESLKVLSINNGKKLREYNFNKPVPPEREFYGSSNEIIYVNKVFNNYLIFFRHCIIELSNNYDFISIASYEELSGTNLYWELDVPVPVIIENKNWLVLSIVPMRGGGATGGLILSFSKEENVVSKAEDSSKDKQKNENDNLAKNNITKDNKRNSNVDEIEKKLSSYLPEIFVIVFLLIVLFAIIVFKRRRFKKN